MALTIVNEQYPPRKPKLTLTADSLDELPTEGVAEGSTATVGGTEYSYDSNAGWIVPGSGGGSSGGGIFPVVVTITDVEQMKGTSNHTPAEILNAVNERLLPVLFETSSGVVLTPPVGVESTETRFSDPDSGYTFYIREDGSVDMST